MPDAVNRWHVPMATADPDILRAIEAYSAVGNRQIRGVDIGNLTYLDERDVQWIIDTYQHAVNRQRNECFWSNVAIVTLLQCMDPASMARYLYGRD